MQQVPAAQTRWQQLQGYAQTTKSFGKGNSGSEAVTRSLGEQQPKIKVCDQVA